MSKHHPSFNDFPCPLASFTALGLNVEVPGLYMVYASDKATARHGDLLSFSVWIMNSTPETLTDVTVILRSLTNGEMERLEYTTQPHQDALTGGTLGPVGALNHILTYEVTLADANYGDTLISALQVELISPTRGKLVSECDAHVLIRKPALERKP